MKTNYWFNRNRLLSGLRFIALLLACFAIAQRAIAVAPEPDGGYPDGNTANEDNAFLDLNMGTDTPTTSFPLKKSPNNRYLVRQDNTPFLVVGDSVWIIVNQATNADIDVYLADRAARGINSIIAEVTDPFYATNAPNNINNVAPFTTPNNFSTPNSVYYNRFDYLVDRAASYGIVVFAFPLYLGYHCNQQGWAQQMIASSTANLRSFATFLGNRYKNKGNIVWVMGGDCDPFFCGLSTKVSAFATSLVAADPNHLVTSHNSRGIEGVAPWVAGGVPSWLKLNTTYTDKFTYSLSQTAYNRTPTRPFLMLETYYENSTANGAAITRKDLRAEAYWSILSGNCGYFFGNCPLWGVGCARSFCSAVNPDWHVHLNSNGSRDLTRFKNVLTSVAWQTLVPDFTHTTVTAGYGSGATTVTTARASDGSFVMSYLPAVRGVTVDMRRLTPSSVRARWYDPTNGTYSTVAGSPFPNTGTRVFTPTGNNSSGASDWVLLLQR